MTLQIIELTHAIFMLLFCIQNQILRFKVLNSNSYSFDKSTSRPQCRGPFLCFRSLILSEITRTNNLCAFYAVDSLKC